jgi:organic hydroperoxide reductase OsmC/OhrA
MSVHRATVRWQSTDAPFTYATYSRTHRWQFEGGTEVEASAAPAYRGDPALVDPEEAFVASLASCHLLTFLANAARDGLVVERYEDEAEGVLAKNAGGRLAVTRVVLRPRVTFGGAAPTAAVVAQMHERAHAACFIANSVRTEVVVEPRGREA